ncbi:hypothetical protein P153DRAFT_144384 [Dothidotthia symphoricarpi CBS 119687]|uniref:Chromo domain-containing protein n=1 Tax=Dothidotthia symphoricarpi CBS 119687 TaxID=1392245 RepID=A0A6A5ZXT5_9PLEO|nr:uncharacterized protein P153DRAFT_144384 [Dothidotthia symphoricarpi CBS 119687]KAF2124086.1 hypothetical protein P153DRAFT_144384 [Dothidotthia symphoricarpi CBS 119687]
MPPALSDVESSGDEQVPAQKKTKQAKAQPDPVEEEEEDEEEDDGSVAEDEYVVEEILKHRFTKDGELELDVKWVGYDDPKDRTWEPESNLSGAIDILEAYFTKIKGRPEPKAGGAKRKGRPSAVKSEPAETPTASAKRAKKEWSPPPGSWEHDVSHIDTVEESFDNKAGTMGRFAYLVWNNQRKTYHPLKHVYQKCPQKMLLYYESHLVFTQNDGMDGKDDSSMKDI